MFVKILAFFINFYIISLLSFQKDLKKRLNGMDSAFLDNFSGLISPNPHANAPPLTRGCYFFEIYKQIPIFSRF